MKPNTLAVKMADGAEDLIEGIGIPYGGLFNGRDIEGEFFTKSTDFALDWFAPGDRPLLYHHGLDKDAGTSVIGRVTEYKATDKGIWVKAQLDRSSEFFDAIAELVKSGLYYSSGAMAHLVQRKKSGEIGRWPWVEMSVTPTPAAGFLSEVDFATAEEHFKSAGIKSAKMEELKSAAVKDLPDGPTMMADADDSGPYPEGSYEDLADDIKQTMCKMMGCYCYVSATFPGYALVVCSDEDEGTKYLRVAYTLDDAGEPVLGEMESVTPAMIPLPVPMTDEAPLAIQSARLSDYAELVTDRTKAVSDRRIKEGRVLSTANRERLVASADALEEALKSMRDLLETTEPQPAQAASVDRISSFALLKLWSEATSE